MRRALLPLAGLAAVALLTSLVGGVAPPGPLPIVIASDAQLAAYASSGDGSAGNPYVVSGWEIATSGPAIELRGTTKHVNLSGLAIAGASTGIKLDAVRNVVVWGATIEGAGTAIHVLRSADVTIGGSTLKTSGTGILLDDAHGVTVRDNRIAVNARDVELRAATVNAFTNNNLSTSTGQFGFYLHDNASFDNSVDPTNVVNGIPLRWYSGVAGTPTAPLVITDATMELPGATNVAQILLHNASHVRLVSPVAKAGRNESACGMCAAGIRLLNAQDVEIVSPVAEGNGGAGIVVESSARVEITDGSATRNVLDGIAVQGSADVTVERTNASANLRDGIAVVASPRATLRSLQLHENARNGVAITSSSGAALLSSTLVGSDEKEVALDLATPFDVSGNTLAGAGAVGLSISRSAGQADGNAIREKAKAVAFASATGSNLSANLVTLAGGTGFWFDGPQSYDNNLTTSNAVNGTALRWYNRQVGTAASPVVLPGLDVQLRGITNVGQIMVYRGANVTLSGPVAKSGAAAGIVVHLSHGTVIDGATVDGNAGDGILAANGSATRIVSSLVNGSGAHGIRIVGAAGASVENAAVRNSTLRGISVDAADGVTLRGNGVVDNKGAGIHLNAVGPTVAIVDNNLVAANGAAGVHVVASTIGTIAGNNLSANGGEGIHLSGVAAGARVDANELAGHARNVRLATASGTELHANRITLAGPTQTGVWFDDEASYNVTAPPSNTVNGVPLRWYVGAANATIADVAANLTGMTNVAQIMLYRAQNVTLENASAINGSARGIYVLRSGNVTLHGSLATGNAKAGLHAEASHDLRANNTTLSRNAQGGAHLQASARATLSNLTVADNAGKGVAFDASDGGALLGGVVERNAGTGVAYASSAGSPGRVENATVRANGAGGILVEGSWLSNVTGNVVLDNGATGLALALPARPLNVTGNTIAAHGRAIQLASAPGSTFRNNTITLFASQTAFHFVDEASYDSRIDTTNLVNGAPMRWYTNLTGPVTLPGIVADVPGMTNVAQVMVYRSSAVTLENASGSYGALHGIYVLGSTGTSIQGSVATRNAGDGIKVVASPGTEIRNTTATTNARSGIHAENASGLVVERAHLNRNGADGATLRWANASAIRATSAQGNAARGIHATLSDFVNLSANEVHANVADGIRVDNASSPRVLHNNLTANGNATSHPGAAGVSLSKIPVGARVESNRVSGSARGISLFNATFGDLHGNLVAINETQVGLFFEDESAYNNVVAPTNLVNGHPVRWFTTLAGTESAPVELRDVTAELRGITNVAQVMVYKSAYVNLTGTIARNGTERGVYLFGSSSIVLAGTDANHSGIGVDLKLTQSSTVRELAARGSGTGVRLVESVSNQVFDVDARGAGAGARLDAASQQNRVEQVEANGTLARGVVDASGASSTMLGKNLIVDAGPGIRVRLGTPAYVNNSSASFRHESERIVQQSWDWGDGATVTSAIPQPFRPNHTYALAATYVVNYTVVTADGKTLWDTTLIEAVPPLTAPAELTAEPGDRNVTLTWKAPLFDGGSNVTKYRIYRASEGANFSLVADLGDVRNHTDAGLVNGRAYAYRVAAVNADGEGPNATVNVTPMTLPSAPRALNATSGPRSVALAWTAPMDTGGRELAGYTVLRSHNGSALVAVATLGNVTQHVDGGLVNGVAYTYVVRAYTELGNGTASSNATATPVGPASAPLGVQALPADAAVTLLWSAPVDTGGAPIIGYRLYRGATPATLVAVADLPANATQHRDGNLSNGQRYHYAIAALNAYGAGDKAGPLDATPTGADSLRPVILEVSPADGAILREGTLTVTARYVDNDGVVPERVTLLLDGTAVALDGAAGPNALSWTAPGPLLRGYHSARLALQDAAGNEATHDWTFRVLDASDAVPAIEYADITIEPARAWPGATVYVNLTARNVGFAPGTARIPLLEDGVLAAEREVTLADGEATRVSLTLVAGEPGLHRLEVANTTLALLVLEAPANGGGAPGEGSVRLPAPALPLVALALLAAALLARRR